MEAKVTKAFSGVPDGEVYPRRFDVGDTVSGDLAASAVASGTAEIEGKATKRRTTDVGKSDAG